MINLLINLGTVVLLTVAAAYLVSGALKYQKSQMMMLAQYVISPSVDINERSALQYDYLSRHLPLSQSAAKQIALSIVAVGVIIGLRLIAGVLLNANL